VHGITLIVSSPSKPIQGIVTFCDIPLEYGLLALASSNQLAAVELDYRVTDIDPSHVSTPDDAPSSQPKAESDPHSLLAKPLDIDRLLKDIRQPSQPYQPRALLNQTLNKSQPLTSITAEHLRTLGQVASQLHTRIEAVRLASQAVEHRLDLQLSEFKRQIALLTECRSRIKALQDRVPLKRAETLLVNQMELADRLDRVLSSMTEEYRPKVGEVERKWFGELERLSQRVKGGGQVKRGKALIHRAQVVSGLEMPRTCAAVDADYRTGERAARSHCAWCASPVGK
jgi:nucleoporin NUP82